jgi:transposase-like protein
LDYLFKLRFGKEFVCPKCNGDNYWPLKNGLYECAGCGHKTSVIAGTIFQDTHKPLTMWFRAIWWITSQKNGASALSLQRILGLESYQTTWTWPHKLRRAMVRPTRDKLSGNVEIDETYIGGIQSGKKRGRGTENKALVAIAAECDGNQVGRIRMDIIGDASAENLHNFIENVVQQGSIIITDGWRGYNGISEKRQTHQIIITHTDDKEKLLPHVHLDISLLKRWIMGTLQSSLSAHHLAYYKPLQKFLT